MSCSLGSQKGYALLLSVVIALRNTNTGYQLGKSTLKTPIQMEVKDVHSADFALLVRAMYDDRAYLKTALGSLDNRFTQKSCISTSSSLDVVSDREMLLSEEETRSVQDVCGGGSMERLASLYALAGRLGCQKLQSELAWYIQEAVAPTLH